MEVQGEAVSFDQAADILAGAEVTKELRAGDLSVKWLKDSRGVKSVLVQGLGDELIRFTLVD